MSEIKQTTTINTVTERSRSIPKGYKKTEVGIIPDDWKLGNMLNNSTLKARIGWQGLTTAEYLKTGNYFLVTGTDFSDGKIKWETCHYVVKERYIQDQNIQLKENDILVTKDGTIGKVAFIDKITLPSTLNSGVFVIRPKHNSYNPHFLYYVLKSFYFDIFLNELVAGSTILHLYQKDFINFKFPLPSIPEQTAIATALSDADILISSLEKLITKKRNIKQGAMQKLLQPKEGWEVKKLGEVIVNFQNGFGFSAIGYVKSGIPIITMAQIGLDGTFNFDETKVNFWQNEDFITLKNFHIKNGDLIIAMTDVTPEKNLIGRMAVVKTNHTLLLNQRVGLLRLDETKVNSYFLKTLSNMRSWRTYCIGSASLGVQANLGTKDILNGGVSMPSIEEQTRIANILSDMDSEIQALVTKLEKYKNIKLGMMQNLLTGKIRLI